MRPSSHLESRAQHVRDAELARQRLDLVARRRRHDRERVPLALVGAHQRARLRVDLGREVLEEDALGHPRRTRLSRVPRSGPTVPAMRPEKPTSPRLKARRGQHRPREVDEAHPAAHHAVANERRRREAREQRAVEIEERADVRARTVPRRSRAGDRREDAPGASRRHIAKGRAPAIVRRREPRCVWSCLRPARYGGAMAETAELTTADAPAWPDANGRRVVFLLDAASPLERRAARAAGSRGSARRRSTADGRARFRFRRRAGGARAAARSAARGVARDRRRSAARAAARRLAAASSANGVRAVAAAPTCSPSATRAIPARLRQAWVLPPPSRALPRRRRRAGAGLRAARALAARRRRRRRADHRPAPSSSPARRRSRSSAPSAACAARATRCRASCARTSSRARRSAAASRGSRASSAVREAQRARARRRATCARSPPRTAPTSSTSSPTSSTCSTRAATARRCTTTARQLEEIYALAQRYPLVFLPSHKSNLDHLVLQYALHENGHPPNHTAGGINMNFFPIGPLVRRSGVFFIRRTLQGQRRSTSSSCGSTSTT